MLILDADGHVTQDTLPNLRQRLPGFHKSRNRIFPVDGWHRDFDMAVGKGEVDFATQLADLDAEGIDVQVCYPTGCLGIGRAQDVQGVTLLASAYNDWLAEFCAGAPERFKGVEIVALQDVDAAVRELERAVTQCGMVGVMVPTFVWPGIDLGGRALDTFYAMAEKLDVPVAIHIVMGPGTLADNRFRNFTGAHVNTPVFEMATAFTQIITGGVLERFESLRIAFLEAGVGWVPYWIERLDEHYELLHPELTDITKKPSEYVRSGRCYFSFEPGERLLTLAIGELGDRVFLYSSDYPHWDCGFPNTVRTVKERSDLSSETKERLLGLNALEFYGIKGSVSATHEDERAEVTNIRSGVNR